MSLGQVDYGLMGTVGGLLSFITFFNGILSISIGRFYAFSVGSAQRSGNEHAGLAECRKWFTVAVSIHTVIPLILMCVGYPIGEWAVRNYLTIPADRVEACVWVFRFVCISCFIHMVNVPFRAMYTAKQEIAELTMYSFVMTTLNALFLYYMVTHPGVWLTKLSLWTCVLSSSIAIIIAIRAVISFPECRLLRDHLWNFADIRKLVSFAGWNFFGSLGNLLKGAGMTVLVNKMFGPARNAAVAIAQTVSGHAQTLSGAMVGAFMPAITNARGAEDRERMVSLVHKTCKFGALLVLPFAIPLSLEIDEVMVLWLKNPPAYSGGLCIWIMAVLILEKMTTGHWVVVAANGNIAWYQFLVGTCFILTLPIAWVMMRCGLGLYSVGYALFTTLAIVAVIRLIAVDILLKIKPWYWINRIFLPILLTITVSSAVGMLPRIYFEQSFLRICITTICCECVLLPLGWFVVLDERERKFFMDKLTKSLGKLLRGK